MEYIDIYDSSKRKIKSNFKRGSLMPMGGYYLIAEVWTMTNNGHILITLRAPGKKSEPGKWENTGSAVISGESSRMAAVRELYEETGIIALEDELTYVATFKGRDLFVDTYFLKKDIDLKTIKLQKTETIAAKLVNYFELKQIIDNGSFSASIAKRLKLIQNDFCSFLEQSVIKSSDQDDIRF